MECKKKIFRTSANKMNGILSRSIIIIVHTFWLARILFYILIRLLIFMYTFMNYRVTYKTSCCSISVTRVYRKQNRSLNSFLYIIHKQDQHKNDSPPCLILQCYYLAVSNSVILDILGSCLSKDSYTRRYSSFTRGFPSRR